MAKLNIQEMSDETLSVLRKKCLKSLFNFSVAVMGFDDITEELHGQVCRFLESPSTRKQLTLPRGFVKTWLATIAYSVWIALPRVEADEFPDGISLDDKFYQLGPNVRVLIASNVVSNANKILSLIRKTYERNSAMQILFPEVIPVNFNKTKWSDSEACIERQEDYTESTFEAGGVGGSTISRHYDIIIEDDLIYAKKDDLSGKELQPDQDDIDKAIGWHKLGMSLLVPGPHTRIHNVGTRWAKHDLVDYIRSNEADYEIMDVSSELPDGSPTWPEMYPRKKLDQIKSAQGPYMYATQYLNKPMAPEDMLFKQEWLQFYKNKSEVPANVRIFTTCDLSGWDENNTRKKHGSRGVVLTCGWDDKNNCWLLHYDVGRFNPSEMIELFYKHWKLFRPELIGVEAVYYQKSLVYFARKVMETRGWLPLRELKTDSNISKELRIRALEPYASNLAIHCRQDHKDFIDEFCEYVPMSALGTKDILDALAYQIQVARPGDAINDTQPVRITGDYTYAPTIDSVLEWFWNKNKDGSAFPEHKIRGDEEPVDDNLFQPLLDDYEG